MDGSSQSRRRFTSHQVCRTLILTQGSASSTNFHIVLGDRLVLWNAGIFGVFRGEELFPLAQQAEPLRHRDQLCQRLHLHLLHDLLAMRLDGALGRSELMGDLLVQSAAYDKAEHLVFARRKRRHQRPHFLDPVPFAANGRVPRQRTLDGAEQLLRFNRLGEEVFRTGLDGSHGGRRVGMPGQEHDRQR